MDDEKLKSSDELEAWLKRSECYGIIVLALTIAKIKGILRPFEDKVTVDQLFKMEDELIKMKKNEEVNEL